MITFVPYSLPVISPLGEAYVIYIETNGQFENDIWTCCLCEGGDIKHFNSSQLKMHENATIGIKKKRN